MTSETSNASETDVERQMMAGEDPVEPAPLTSPEASHVAMPKPAGARVLVIDDEPEITHAVRKGLASTGFVVEAEATGAQGIQRVARWHPDLVILDLSLPDADGIAICREMRTWTRVPIIVLSVRADEVDKIAALESGADDYLTKPFGMGELIARIRVALRHAALATGTSTGAHFETGTLRIDFERRRVTVDGVEKHLTPTEYEVLKYLAQHVGQVVTHRMLLHAVWGPDYETEAHYLRVFINQLRRKIEPDSSRPHYLLTEPGVGYRLRSPD